jgi:hypothetical protein
MLARADLEVAGVRMGELVDAPRPSACALDLGRGAALHGVALPKALLRGATLVVDARHPAVVEARAIHPAKPQLAALAVAEAIALRVAGDASTVDDVAEAWAELR